MLGMLEETFAIPGVSETQGLLELVYTEHVPLCFPVTGWQKNLMAQIE